MTTKLIKGVEPLAMDSQILAAIEDNTHPDLGGTVMVIGVRNGAGKLYRTAKVAGLASFMGVVGALQDLGLTDELEHETGMREGCDAIFSATE